MLVSVLASGSEGNCTLVKTKTKTLLIDLGMNYKYIKSNLNDLGINTRDIDYVLVTHAHSDHTGAMKQFLKDNHPTIFISEDCLSELDIIKDYDDFIFDSGSINLGDIIIETFNTSHDAKGSRGYIVKEEDTSMVYITDTGYINQKLFKVLKNHDLYVFESNHDIELLMHGKYPAWLKKRISSDVGHLSNTQASFYLSKLIGDKTKYVLLAHLSHENNDPILALNNMKDALIECDFNLDNILTCEQKQRTDVLV